MAEIERFTITMPPEMTASVNEATDSRFHALRQFFDAVSQMPVKDARSIDDILGYAHDGLCG